MNNNFSMCVSHNCKLRTKCLRHAESGTKPNPARQSYGYFQPDNCEYFIEKFDEPNVYQGKYKHVNTSSEKFANNKEA